MYGSRCSAGTHSSFCGSLNGAVVCFKVATVAKRLPKTRSGKIVRGTIKKISDPVDYRITPTIDDAVIPDEITADLAALGYPQS